MDCYSSPACFSADKRHYERLMMNKNQSDSEKFPFFCNANYMCLFPAVKSAKSKINTWNKNKSPVAALKADVQLSAAPDSVDHEILFDCAQYYAVRAGTVPNWLRIYLTNWEISQHVGTCLKNELLRCFLRQCSVCVGPLLCYWWWLLVVQGRLSSSNIYFKWMEQLKFVWLFNQFT